MGEVWLQALVFHESLISKMRHTTVYTGKYNNVSTMRDVPVGHTLLSCKLKMFMTSHVLLVYKQFQMYSKV